MLARTFGRVAVLLFFATVPGAADAQSEVALDSLFKLGVGLADQYFRQEGDRQVRQATPDQGHATHYSASDVRAWQKKLNFLGYDAGPPDGVFGERTKRAIAAYQRSIGAPVTGILTPLQQEALLSEPKAVR